MLPPRPRQPHRHYRARRLTHLRTSGRGGGHNPNLCAPGGVQGQGWRAFCLDQINPSMPLRGADARLRLDEAVAPGDTVCLWVVFNVVSTCPAGHLGMTASARFPQKSKNDSMFFSPILFIFLTRERRGQKTAGNRRESPPAHRDSTGDGGRRVGPHRQTRAYPPATLSLGVPACAPQGFCGGGGEEKGL